jgi:transcriptional regulator with XRE-family HTH domain
MNPSLDTKIRTALESKRGDWQTIASESGVSYSWLSKFANGHIPNPGYETLKKLAKVLDVKEAA